MSHKNTDFFSIRPIFKKKIFLTKNFFFSKLTLRNCRLTLRNFEKFENPICHNFVKKKVLDLKFLDNVSNTYTLCVLQNWSPKIIDVENN